MIETLLTYERTPKIYLRPIFGSKEDNDTLITKRKNETDDIDTIHNLLLELHPLIHFTAHVLRLIQWKNVNPKYSLTSILLWMAIRSMHDFILYLMPIILLSAIISLRHVYPSAHTTIHRQHCKIDKDNSRKKLKEDLTEICKAFHFISSIKDTIQNSDTLCNLHHKQFSITTAKQRSTIYVGAACLFIMFCIEWVILIRQQIVNNCASVLWFFIFTIMCLSSPWSKLMLNAISYKVFPFIYFFTIPHDTNGITIVTKSDIATSPTAAIYIEKQPSEYTRAATTTVRGYCFEIYHHQRWWFPYGWSNLLLPQDRPVWSDIHLEPTPSIYQFKLPPTTTYADESNGFRQQKTVTWTWIDPSWSKQHPNYGTDISCDKDGWQYGSWKWKSWSFQSSGLGIHTRRQKWVRYAQRKETLIRPKHSTIEEEKVRKSTYCTSLIGGSDTTTISSTSSSIYNWDDTTTTGSRVDSCNNISIPSSSSSTSISFKPPNLILDVVNPTFLRSSHSAIFNTPILSWNNEVVRIAKFVEENDKYQGYCNLSNINKKPKRHSV